MPPRNMMNINGMSQTEMLMKHFEEHESISSGEAQMVYRIRSLPRRIMDLKNKGYEFRHDWNRDATGQRYIRYVLTLRPTQE
jgi:hypothetical protein